MVFPYSVSDPIKYHVNCSIFFCFAIPLTILFAVVLYISTGVVGCWWSIYARAVLMAVAFWQFSNNPPNSVSVADAITFLIMLHYTCTGPFWGKIDCIGVLDIGPKKNIHQICFVTLVLKLRMHPNKYGESFQFFYILLLRLDVSRYSLKIVLFASRF